MHLRCLVFKLHKIIGQRFSNLYRGSKSKIAPILMKHISNYSYYHKDSRKRIVLYISDADLLTYDQLGACTGSFIHKLYG